ncbi:putative oxygen-independent coproporphyrinogen III oxidase [Gaiella occulta]|uniref:Heme chaperone HemW n=1 Tax=Gaiella occulta TaxID=1002870 RepID=A0A7M2YTJ5_9ACTN|nr:radical SAM family heme chaperone HemW [Gaiella occulta]RDI73406.1 putative oxygen-independent coproporphyrinogen III oxidase [Gaiella occulta]
MTATGAPAAAVRHLYLHLPFCAHRCGYCDFVTVVGRAQEHGPYVDALLVELERERHVLSSPLETVFLGGGTPTFTHLDALRRVLEALPAAGEVTVEANPETVTPELAALLREGGVTRVSLGAQTFAPRLLEVLERVSGPDDVRHAVHTLRDACFDNISLDLVYGIPGQEPADLDRDLAEALALAPEHLSCYELEAKPGTRFTHAFGDELARQAEAMEGYFEHVVETLTGAGYRWYETANFCLDGGRAGGRDLRARHNLGIWRGRSYLGVGIGAVSTLAGVRRRNLPSLGRYVGALRAGESPPREVEELDAATKARERLMLGLRLDEPLLRAGLEEAIDERALERLVAGGLVERVGVRSGTVLDEQALRLTRRGRFLGGGVTAELLA